MIDAVGQRRVALAHDWLVGLRGGEWVLDRLARLFGPTDLYVLVDDRRHLTDAIAACRVVPSPLQRLPGASGRWRRQYFPLMPWAVERLRVAPCDLLISTSSAVMKSIRPPAGTPHLCYCHSPARYVWEQGDDYAIGSGRRLRSLGLRLMGRSFRAWDRRTADRVTQFLANSRHTAERIERCYDRTAEVVHPPVRTGFFTPDERVPREPWYLVVSALEPYKRTDLAVAAANRGGFALRVVGTGSQERMLRAMAGPTVEFHPRVDDERLRDLYRRARALLFVQQEDFGIVAVEAQATGCPVIAYAAGGALDSVTERSGILMRRQGVEDVLEAIRQLESAPIDSRVCRANAERFRPEAFDDAVMRHAAALLSA